MIYTQFIPLCLFNVQQAAREQSNMFHPQALYTIVT